MPVARSRASGHSVATRTSPLRRGHFCAGHLHRPGEAFHAELLETCRGQVEVLQAPRTRTWSPNAIPRSSSSRRPTSTPHRSCLPPLPSVPSRFVSGRCMYLALHTLHVSVGTWREAIGLAESVRVGKLVLGRHTGGNSQQNDGCCEAYHFVAPIWRVWKPAGKPAINT